MSSQLNYTERYEESYLSPNQNKIQKVKEKKANVSKPVKKVTISMAGNDRKRDMITSVESLDSIESDRPMVHSSRDDVLQSLGYNPHKVAKPMANATSLATSHNLCHFCSRRVYPMEKVDIGEIYHRGCFKCHTCGLQLTLRTFCKVTLGGNQQNVFCKTHVPKLEASYNKEAMEIKNALKAQKSSTDKLLRQFEPSPNKYDPGAMEFEHARKMKNSKVKRRRSLKTGKDFLKFGVFEAQEKLERKHREEEDVLYTEMYEERKMQMMKLEKDLLVEKEKTVKELIAWFDGQKKSETERATGLKKVEQYYREQKESKVKDLLDKLHLEEQEAVARLTHKHAQEMLFMIEQKEIEVEGSLEQRKENYKRQSSDKEVSAPGKKTFEEDSIEEEEDEDKEDEDEDDEDEDEDDEEDEDAENHEAKEISKSPVKGQKDIIVGMREELYRDTIRDVLTLAPSQKKKDKELERDAKKKSGEIERGYDGDEDQFENLRNKAVERYEEGLNKDGKKVVKNLQKSVQMDEDTVEENKLKQRLADKKHKYVIKKTTENDEEEEEASGSEELESVEDRIRRVLKKKNIELSEGTLEQEYCNNAKGIAFERLPKSDNIWKSSHETRASNMEKRRSKKLLEEEEEEDEDSPRLSMAPEAVPPMCRKSRLYKDPDVFREFDEAAFEEAKNDPISFTDLVRKLTLNCKTDLQKVRAIFRWITAKDLNKMKFSEGLTTNTPMGLLRGIKTGTESYHNLFKRLCSYVGIHCEIINGFSKGVGYKPGSKFKDSRFRNQWTAVWIKDSWRFINCNWGARHVKQLNDQQLTYKIDEFYFLTDPEDHIQQHFPDDVKWQLLRKAFTLEEFVKMPVVKSPFFNNNLKFASKYESIMRASSHGYIELKISVPALMSFASKLESRDKSVSSSDLVSCCVTRNVGNLMVFSATLPAPGKYFWDIYVDKKWKSSSLDNACSVMLYCSENPSFSYKLVSYPYASCFGKTPDSEKYGLEVKDDHDPYCICKGDLELVFDISYQSNTKYSLGLSFHNAGKKDEDVDCSSHSMIRCRTDSKLHCHLRLPFKGFYILTLSAIERGSGGKHHTPKPIYRGLIDCKSPSKNTTVLPYATSKWRDCWLVEPMDGELVMNTKVNFKVESASVFEVVVNLNDDWFSLQKADDKLWHGVVNTGVKPGKLEVFGRFDAKSDKYASFLSYKVVEPSLKQEVNNLYKYI